ncbi:MAG: SGNH/GDSL hydrolase family protein, partial [Acidobacteriota bacterium]|nr:SGNH/GDSL hydrolase family protein [Acidobacteriota bacterium]
MRKALLLALTLGGTLFGQGFYLRSGDRVVFYGDSITDQRLYTTFTETYVVTRYPRMPITFIHSGWGGDRVTGGGGGSIDVRLDRDVIPYRPTVMTIMLGMNDAGYRAFDQKLFDTFSRGYEHIIEKVKTDIPGIRITVIEPSPFDDTTRAPNFEGGYNKVLDRYSQYLGSLAQHENLLAADLNAPVVQMLTGAKNADAALSQKIIPDRVHPGAAGHLIMAEGLLKAWNATPVVTNVEIDAATGKLLHAGNTAVTNLSKGGTLTWEQMDQALPFPIDWNDKDKLVPLAVRSSDFLNALDQETLRVPGLEGERYMLRIDGAEAGTFTKEDLGRGINLAMLSTTPMMKQAMDVHALTLKRTGIHQFRWRNIQVPMASEDLPNKAAAMA